MARFGLLGEAQPVFTQGARLPLAGLWLVGPALAVTGLVEVFESTYGRLRDRFYGLRPIVLTLLFLALLRDPRAEGLTRLDPADLGRLLGLDRARRSRRCAASSANSPDTSAARRCSMPWPSRTRPRDPTRSAT